MTVQYKNQRMLGNKAGSFTGSRSLPVPGKWYITKLQYIGI